MARGLMLISLLLQLTGCAEAPDQRDADFTANVVASMQHALRLHAELRGRPVESLSADEREVLLQTLHQITGLHSALTGALPRLEASRRRTQALADFLKRWPVARLEDGLLAAPSARHGLDADVRTLTRSFPQDNWRTLFPLFRP